jgi:hypothetical protein
MNLKELFDKAENGTFNYEQFQEATKDLKLVDLSEGAYVSKSKYEDDIKTRDTQIDTLNATIGSRDKDLEAIQKQLSEAGVDAEKLSTLSNDLSTLQGKYDTDIKQYKEQLRKQSYEFAVKEFANSQKFSSNAAKRDFINSLVNANLKMQDNEILGANDFMSKYTEANADAFVVETPKPQPTIVASTTAPTPQPKQSLSDLMAAKNNNPDMEVNY